MFPPSPHSNYVSRIVIEDNTIVRNPGHETYSDTLELPILTLKWITNKLDRYKSGTMSVKWCRR
ncbi:hypothetical protein Hypma_004473 [Hypsizygus marmoreus]|uniref:Uncharacterized protein n=1 Tax=Hypsizygus marmoreus TaxID=39966 RepID=A0A369K390_HYPMA|nr:hypothetical protein Hypma_004473 [Hypsizygus marmoreus]